MNYAHMISRKNTVKISFSNIVCIACRPRASAGTSRAMQGPAGATAPGLAAAPPFGLEAPYLGQQTAGIHLLPPGRHAPLSRPLTITSTRPSGAASPFLTGDTAEPSRSCSRARRCLECRANRGAERVGLRDPSGARQRASRSSRACSGPRRSSRGARRTAVDP